MEKMLRLLQMCCQIVLPVPSCSSAVNLLTQSSTCSDVNPRISTVLSKSRCLTNDTAVGLVVVKTVAPPKSLPEAILYNAGTDIFAVTSLG